MESKGIRRKREEYAERGKLMDPASVLRNTCHTAQFPTLVQQDSFNTLRPRL